MPKCPWCDKECVEGKRKDGKPMLMDLRPHFISCKPRVQARRAEAASPRGEAREYVMSLGYKAREADAMLRDVPDGTVEEMVRWALKGATQ